MPVIPNYVFYLSENESLRLKLQCHSVPDIVDELFKTKEFHCTQ